MGIFDTIIGKKEVEEKAQKILQDLQDKKIHEQEKPKQKSTWD